MGTPVTLTQDRFPDQTSRKRDEMRLPSTLGLYCETRKGDLE